MEKRFDESVPSLRFAGGVDIPQIGFGTFKIPACDTQRAVEEALALGYRHVDTAAAYNNEEGVGAALKALGKEDEVFVTTKLRNADQGYESAMRAFEESRAKLGVDIVDLYLIHWPAPSQDRYVDAWRALIELRDQGAVRAIGVSNFMREHLERIELESGQLPCINQIESHPGYWQPDLEEYCVSKGIAIEAYSPLGHGGDMASAPAVHAAERLGVTPAQVVLRWHLQKGHVFIPKSTHVDRMRANLDVLGFELGVDDIAALDGLDADENRCGNDPYTFDRPQTLEDMLSRGNL
ncbi:aldo/keto reductase [Collinsella tanakaei]|uniref:aldo/keto reductase n=1 Tax=Collinsella tanakaei TaxID=626935 RepID=UPI002943ABE8|nr:aldo/keto reductase [Collinsella tanakaei]